MTARIKGMAENHEADLSYISNAQCFISGLLSLPEDAWIQYKQKLLNLQLLWSSLLNIHLVTYFVQCPVATFVYHPPLLQSCFACIRYIWHQYHVELNVLIFIPGDPAFKPQTDNHLYRFRFFACFVCALTHLFGSDLPQIWSLQYRSTSFLTNRFHGAYCFLKT